MSHNYKIQSMFNDIDLFHKVVYKIIPATMTDYLTLYSEDSRLRSTLLTISFVSKIVSTTTSINNLVNPSLFVATRFGIFYHLISEIHSLKLNHLSIFGI